MFHGLVLSILFLQTSSGGVNSDQLAKFAQQISASCVQVEYTLKYDQSDAPVIHGARRRCPNCGEYHIEESDSLVKEERPLSMPGYLLSPTKVVSTDPIIPSRFVERIGVRMGAQVVEANIAGYSLAENAVFLDLKVPLSDARPITFGKDGQPPFISAAYGPSDGGWSISVSPVAESVYFRPPTAFRTVPSNSLVIDSTGAAVGMSFKGELRTDNSWKGSPADWETVSAKSMTEQLQALQQSADGAIRRVSLGFRSPKSKVGRNSWDYEEEEYDYDETGTASATERETIGVVFDSTQVLILASVSAKTTARLERISIHDASGQTTSAKFKCSLRDYGAFVATLDSPIQNTITLSKEELTKYRHDVLGSAEISIRGDRRICHMSHDRLRSLEFGWRNKLFPKDADYRNNTFWFTRDTRELVALPIERREKISVREDWSDASPELTPASHLVEVLANLSGDNIDPSNVPLNEDEEQRMAWLGVELQPLDQELARANGVSHLTSNGESGALVTYIYANSPAAKNGVQVGWVLLRLHVPSHPKPLEVSLDETREYGGFDFPWDRLGELPDQLFERLPTPWPSVENKFTRALTDLGFGTRFVAEFAINGVLQNSDFTVEQSPPHFLSAAKYKSESLGLTARDITYEVRRYFQYKPEDPGVVVSKIEPGSKAAVAKVVPYELITHVNGAPVKSVVELESALKDQTQVQLSLKRQSVGRVVKIELN